MTQIAYSGLFWTQFRVLRDLLTDLTAGKPTVRTFLPRLLTAASRIQNCTYRKIITYQTPQWNLPIVNLIWARFTHIYAENLYTIYFFKLLRISVAEIGIYQDNLVSTLAGDVLVRTLLFHQRPYHWWCRKDRSLQHDVIKWWHFPRYWPFVWGTHRWPVNSPHKGQWRGPLMF